MVGAAARRVLCNQSCFGASEFTALAFDRRGNVCSVTSVLSIVVRRSSLVSTRSRTTGNVRARALRRGDTAPIPRSGFSPRSTPGHRGLSTEFGVILHRFVFCVCPDITGETSRDKRTSESKRANQRANERASNGDEAVSAAFPRHRIASRRVAPRTIHDRTPLQPNGVGSCPSTECQCDDGRSVGGVLTHRVHYPRLCVRACLCA